MKITENINRWLAEGERGISSEAIISYLTGINIGRDSKGFGNHPSDPSDFERCSELLKMCPEIKAELYQMKEVSGVWSKLVENWDILEQMLEDGREQILQTGTNDDKMYQFMKSLGC